VVLIGCAEQSSKEKASSSADMLSYAKNAEELYKKGMQKLDSHNVTEASKIFTQLKEKYPYSRYAQLAELRLADCDFESEDFAQAGQKYKDFVRRYPSHPEVGYSMYRRAMSTYKRIPGSLFILPRVYERDLSFAKEAAREFKEFLDFFPQSPYFEDAKKHYLECLDLLVKHELTIARYYFDRGKYDGAIARCKKVMEKLEESNLVPSAILLLGECYLKMKKSDQAQWAFTYLISKYPLSYQAKQAKLYVEAEKNNVKK